MFLCWRCCTWCSGDDGGTNAKVDRSVAKSNILVVLALILYFCFALFSTSSKSCTVSVVVYVLHYFWMVVSLAYLVLAIASSRVVFSSIFLLIARRRRPTTVVLVVAFETDKHESMDPKDREERWHHTRDKIKDLSLGNEESWRTSPPLEKQAQGTKFKIFTTAENY